MPPSSTPVKVGNEASKYPSIYDLSRVIGQDGRQISQELRFECEANMSSWHWWFSFPCLLLSALLKHMDGYDQRRQVKA